MKSWLILFVFLTLSNLTIAGQNYKPFISVATPSGGIEQVTETMKNKLFAAGFEVVGSYSPYADGSARIIGVTNDALKAIVAKSKRGGFGAVIRVAITGHENKTIEVSYTNPTYTGYAYHLGALSGIKTAMQKALGRGKAFGSKKGLSKKSLKKYRYSWLMPYFKDAKVIASFPSHQAAIAGLNKAIKNPGSDMTKIWQVPISKKQTVYGVQLNKNWWKGKMKSIMAKLDKENPRSTAALPWEILVSGNEIIYLPGKFRIALMFPDTTMGQFMSIKNVPDKMDSSALKLAEFAK